jgi:hypothetical protein
VPNPTQQLPAYEYGYDPYGTGSYSYGPPPQPDEPPPPPTPPPSRKWLWVLATLSVLTVLGLVIAVVIIDSSSQQTVVAPRPGLQSSEPSSPTTTRTPATTPSRPRTTTPRPTPTTPSVPVIPTAPSGPSQTVVYEVGGTGRAISITYVDAGGILQTEFNVTLPWSKEVELADADTMASVNIINFGREVTCTITVAGEQVESNTSAGLTICGALR